MGLETSPSFRMLPSFKPWPESPRSQMKMLMVFYSVRLKSWFWDYAFRWRKGRTRYNQSSFFFKYCINLWQIYIFFINGDLFLNEFITTFLASNVFWKYRYRLCENLSKIGQADFALVLRQQTNRNVCSSCSRDLKTGTYVESSKYRLFTINFLPLVK